MSERPLHMHQLSAIWWKMVDGMTENGWSKERANNVIELFFTNFEPLPRDEVQSFDTSARDEE